MGALLAVLVHDGVDALAHVLIVDVDASLLHHHAAFLFVEVVVALVLAPATGLPRGRHVSRNDFQMALDVARRLIFLIGQVALQAGLHGSPRVAAVDSTNRQRSKRMCFPASPLSLRAYQHSLHNSHTHRKGKSENHSVEVGLAGSARACVIPIGDTSAGGRRRQQQVGRRRGGATDTKRQQTDGPPSSLRFATVAGHPAATRRASLRGSSVPASQRRPGVRRCRVGAI